MTGRDNPRFRQAARALVLDPTDAVLLVCFATDHANYWATPGGGLEPDESMHAGLQRELAEELGPSDLDIGPLLWTRTSSFSPEEHYEGQYNEIYLVRCKRFDPHPGIGWEGMNAEGVTEMRWWTLDEIEHAGADDVFVPSDLAALVRELLADGPPTRPRSLNATSFGTAADTYEQGRPGYPLDAVRWLVAEVAEHGTVLDLGAGTGKLTDAIIGLGFDAIAVDPDASMLSTLRERLPQVTTHLGVGEAIDLPDACVDAGVSGQAWHWVDPVEASAEMGRVIRPGGTLGLVWNIRDERVDWVAEMTDVMHASPAETMVDLDAVEVGAPFGAVERALFEWSRPMTRPDIEAMVRSRSYYLSASTRRRQDIDGSIAEILDRLDLHGDATIEMPYVTYGFRYRRD